MSTSTAGAPPDPTAGKTDSDQGGRSKRNLGNALFSVSESLVTPVLFFLTTPVFLYQLGTDHYGLWMMANAVNGFSGIMTLGSGEALIAFVAKAVGRGDQAAIIRLSRAAMTITLVMGMIAAGTLALAAAPLVDHLFNVPAADRDLAVSVLLLAALGMAIRFVDTVSGCMLAGSQRYDLTGRVSIHASIATVASTLGLAVAGFGIVAILWAVNAVLIAQAVVRLVVAHRTVAGRDWRFILPTRRVFPEPGLFEFSMMSWIQYTGGIILAQLDRFFVLSFLGPSALAIYGTCLQACQLIHLIPMRLLAFTFPRAAELHAQGDRLGLARVYGKGMFISATAGVALAAPLIIMPHQILAFWLNVDLANQAAPVMAILATVFAVLATTIMPYNVMSGAGMIRANTALSMGGSLVVAVVSWFASGGFGLIGASWSRLANLPSSIFGRGLIYRRIFQESIAAGIVRDLLPVALGLGCCWAASPLAPWTWQPSFLVLAPTSVTCLAIAALLVGGTAWAIRRR